MISVLPEFPPEDSDFDPPLEPQAASARRAAPATNEHNTFFHFHVISPHICGKITLTGGYPH